MISKRILIVEDDPFVLELCRRALNEAGYQVLVAQDGVTGVQIACSEQPDLIQLDRVLPKLGGVEVCQILRYNPLTRHIPILMLTALHRADEQVSGFHAGAGAYLAKPFNIADLLSTVAQLLAQAESSPPPPTLLHEPPPIWEQQPIRLDENRLLALVDGRQVNLTLCEFKLLQHLVQHRGQVFSAEQLLRMVWGYSPDCADLGLVRWHMCKLRSKIEPDPKAPTYLRTVARRGYLFDGHPHPNQPRATG
ncbi:MAG: response regulator transcription factor [Roseiflexaceae bacterium]